MCDGVDYDGTIRLLELAEVPQEFLEEFNSGRCNLDLFSSVCYLTGILVRKFKIFNTNNLWINLRGKHNPAFSINIDCWNQNQIVFLSALKRVVEKEGLELEIFANNKTLEDGRSVLQVLSFIRFMKDF